MVDKPIQNRQDAYNAYAQTMENGNQYYRGGNLEMAQKLWDKAEEFWDLYYYWDEVESE